MFTDDVAQPPAHSISDDGGADAFRCDESGPKAMSLLRRKDADNQQFSALGAAFFSDAFEFRWERESARFWKSQSACRCHVGTLHMTVRRVAD